MTIQIEKATALYKAGLISASEWFMWAPIEQVQAEAELTIIWLYFDNAVTMKG